MTTRIDVIRHGEPTGGRRYRGHGVDDALTEAGWQQMWSTVEDNPGWTHIATSPLVRCRDFAQALSDKLDIGISIDDRLKEIGFGTWEGLTPDDILAMDKNALNHFYADPINNRPEGAEPLQSFSSRVWEAYNELAEKHADQHVLIIGHAGVVRAITANMLHMPLDDVYSKLKIEYGGIICSMIENGSKPRLVVTAG